jgi:hypothetical protein
MIDSASTPSSNEQARLELSVAASSAERSNRPRGLIILSILAVLVCTGVVFASLNRRAEATKKLTTAQDRLRTLVEGRDEITRVTRILDAKGVAPDTRMASRIEKLATDAGVELVGAISDSDDTTNTMQGAVHKIYTAQVKPGADPSKVLTWLASVQADENTRNLEITQLRISQSGGNKGQTATEVRFARWEKREVRR